MSIAFIMFTIEQDKVNVCTRNILKSDRNITNCMSEVNNDFLKVIGKFWKWHPTPGEKFFFVFFLKVFFIFLKESRTHIFCKWSIPAIPAPLSGENMISSREIVKLSQIYLLRNTFVVNSGTTKKNPPRMFQQDIARANIWISHR